MNQPSDVFYTVVYEDNSIKKPHRRQKFTGYVTTKDMRALFGAPSPQLFRNWDEAKELLDIANRDLGVKGVNPTFSVFIMTFRLTELGGR
jgi:hypothetical protein